MNKVLICIALTLWVSQLQGQSVSSEVHSTLGGFYEQSSASLSVTAGETVIAFHSTENHSLSAGFQQSYYEMLKQLIVSIFLEGPYQSGQMNDNLNSLNLLPLQQPYGSPPWNYNGTESLSTLPANAVDWVLVELRDADSPGNAGSNTTLPGWPKALLINKNGQLADLDGTPKQFDATAQHGLYIIIRHRNHLDVMSSTPLQQSGNTMQYDFTDALSKAYGGALGYKEIASGIFGMVAGDSDADNAIFASDYNVWAGNFGNVNVYVASDTDMDGQVFASDHNKWALNFGMNPPGLNAVLLISQVPK